MLALSSESSVGPSLVDGAGVRTISWSTAVSHGWPTIIRRRDGVLMVVYSGGRDAHICPFGRVEMMVSHDEGETWSWPRVVFDGDLDDRDGGIVESASGTLLLTTFSHVMYDEAITAYEEEGRQIPFIAEGQLKGPLLRPERLAAWKAARRRLGEEQRRSLEGEWMIRSTDQGATWSAPFRSLVNSPHGPTALRDGRLLYAGKVMHGPQKGSVGVCESVDDGQSWHWLATIPVRSGDVAAEYHELHMVEADDGTFIVHLRNHNPLDYYAVLQSESRDGGRSWSMPHPIGVWGFPSHLLRLEDGRLLMTYSHRRSPYNCQARLSHDHGRTWSEAIHLYPDSGSADFGYPSTVELSNGWLLTLWYQDLPGEDQTVLRQLRWRP